MLLSNDRFCQIARYLSVRGGARRRERAAEVTLATASGRMFEGRISHFARGGLVIASDQPMPVGSRFGFQVVDQILFCEVLDCRPTAGEYVISASYLTEPSTPVN